MIVDENGNKIEAPSSSKSANDTDGGEQDEYDDQDVGGSSNVEAVTVADNDSINLMIALGSNKRNVAGLHRCLEVS